jgi:hypothetical protein
MQTLLQQIDFDCYRSARLLIVRTDAGAPLTVPHLVANVRQPLSDECSHFRFAVVERRRNCGCHLLDRS